MFIKATKRIISLKLSFILVLVIVIGIIPSEKVHAASFSDINKSTMFFKQNTSSTCTLASAAMLVRRAALLNGNSSWTAVTENNLKSTAWLSGTGLYNSFSYAGINVSSTKISSNRTQTMINLLSQHPEGIVIYDYEKPHAILLTDYTNGIFYCADPSGGAPSGRIPISQATITIESIDKYWYVSSPRLSLTSSDTIPDVTFDDESVTNLTDTNATISTWVNNTGSITERGFYIGMSDEYQNKVVIGTGRVEWTRFREEYNIADYYGELTPGIRYTYVFYVKKGDKEYHSSVGHFTTAGSADIMFDTYGLDNISEDSAYISTWFSNPKGYKISSLGFSISENFKSLKKVEVFSDVEWTRAEAKCEIKDYAGDLKASTDYVARFYVTIGLQTYYSDYICFSTTPPTVTFDSGDVSNLTDTNATISTWVSNAGNITERGFYIGMSDEYQNKVVVGTEQVEWTRFREEYNIADYYGELTPGIRYTYVFYVKKGDKEYHSSVGHFTTAGSADIMFDTYGLNNISGDSAYISTWFSNPNGYMISSYGFLIGEDFKSLEKAEVLRDIGWTRAETKCEIKDYAGELKPLTNYVVRFYMTIGSQTYYSDYIVFSTISSIENIEKEHTWNEGVVTKEATCTVEGVKNYTCTRCGVTREETIVAKGHVRNYFANNDGTHSAICNNCGEVKVSNCSYDESVIESTCNSKGAITYTCSVCKHSYQEEIPVTGHKYATTTVAATVGKSGVITTSCEACGEKKLTTIDAPKTVVLSKTESIYNGKQQKPEVIVKDEKGKILRVGSDYTVSYQKDMKNVGHHVVTVFFQGNYCGKTEMIFVINPKGTSITKVMPKKKGFELKWKKRISQTVGYEIAYSTSSKFSKKNTKTVSVKKNNTTSKFVSKLKAKKKYYVRIRTYKTVKVNGKFTKIHSAWSKVKTVRTKK